MDALNFDLQDLNSRIAAAFDVDAGNITPESGIVSTLQLDSLSVFTLTVIVKKKTGVSIPVCDFPGLVTFGDLYEYIDKKLVLK